MNHVVGSAALVERLWSVARYILTYERSNMAPELLEAILFLYYNRDMWSLATVHRAHCALRQEKREERIAEKLKSINLYDSDSESEDEEEGKDDGSLCR